MQQNYIAGQWVDGDTVSRNLNPSDLSDVVGEYAQANADQVREAIRAARKASSAWAHSTAQAKADALDKIGSEILARKQELSTLLAREEGKTLAEADGEVTRAVQVFKFFAGEALRVTGEKLPICRPGIEPEITREPVGVVGIITPWNFPIAIPAWKIAPALAYGNAVVFKPADLVPASAWALAEIISRAGLPEGTFNLVMGRGTTVGKAIIGDPGVDAITFTGSVNTGRTIAASAIERMAKVQLEMGGKNPLVVMDDADLSVAVECAANGAFFATGQRCTASSRLLVHKNIHGKFVDALIERMGALRVGHALHPDTRIGPVVDAGQLEQNQRYVEIGRKEGAKLAFGGERLKRDTDGYYFSPALFTECDNRMQISQEEIFGPVAAVIPFASYEEALELANDTPFGLSSGICTSSLKHANHFKRHAQAGMVMVNCPTAGVDAHVPFGGRKGSSYGPREQGRYAAEFFTTVKTTYVAS